MTLIANTLNFAYPILVGDILMSSSHEKNNVHLPTFLKGVDDLLPSEQKLFPFSLRQKIYIISDNLVVGLTGIEYQLKAFIEDIRLYFRVKESTAENIKQFFEEYDFSEFDKSSCIAIFSENTENGIIIDQRIIGSWTESKSATYEYVIAGGSGSQYFIQHAKKEYYVGGYGDKSNLHKAISLNYINLCNLLGIERLSLDTLREYWGAGFEMIFFNGERFIKMDDMTYVIWKGYIDLKSEEYSAAPFLVMNYNYYDDILLITASDGSLIERYLVPPIDKKKEDIDLELFPKKPTIDCTRICCSYVLEFSNGKINTPSFFAESKEKPGIISIDFDNDGRLQIMVQQNVERFLIQNIKQLIK